MGERVIAAFLSSTWQPPPAGRCRPPAIPRLYFTAPFGSDAARHKGTGAPVSARATGGNIVAKAFRGGSRVQPGPAGFRQAEVCNAIDRSLQRAPTEPSCACFPALNETLDRLKELGVRPWRWSPMERRKPQRREGDPVFALEERFDPYPDRGAEHGFRASPKNALTPIAMGATRRRAAGDLGWSATISNGRSSPRSGSGIYANLVRRLCRRAAARLARSGPTGSSARCPKLLS